ncbi:hypothetical protein [Streptomyces sp. NPDC048442]|uniref:hypothetical protein n=1 Tax=Streptomyces sp. NPDC048442 TaxID=3154823 RepID=UPI0034145FAB
MSHHQPSPYGGQPQQPGQFGPGQPQQRGPYGQPPQGVPQQGYGYPQQGQPGGPRQPQQPGHHDVWGPHGQVPPSPPSGGGGGTRAGLIVGAVVALFAIGGGAWYLTAGGDGGGDAGGGTKLTDDGPHRLTAPAEVLDGTYKSVTKKDDEPRALNESKAKYLAGTGISADAESVVNVYSVSEELHGAPKVEGLTFLGIHGEVKDPETTLDAVFAKMKERPGTTFLGDARKMSPDDLNGAVMKCQKVQSQIPSIPGHTESVRCVWADHSTIGVVTPSKPAAEYSMEEAAKIAAALRKEVRIAAK